jgi:cytochrome oxidase Cu insertion factor (SCO1/SenC/PrrC family)
MQAPSEAAATIPRLPQAPNPRLDKGMALSAVAPGFTLTDQFGKRVSLSSLRGKVVVLSFNDPQCTTICPLTTTAMLEAKKLLGPAGAKVELLGVGANPEVTSVSAVRDYSVAHRMLHKWRFLTGSLPQLQQVWKSYAIYAAVIKGAIDHTPATYVIDPQGRETRLFVSAMSYSSVPQLAEVLARGIAADLPGHPQVRSSVSLATIKLIGPRQKVALASASGGKVALGPGHGPQLLLFFDTWEQRVSGLTAGLEGLNRYAAMNSVAPLVAIDEAGVEPSPTALPLYLYNLPGQLAYPVGIDADGRVADGYGVQDSPWLTLVSGDGRILWRYDVATKGWPTTAQLVRRVHALLAR